MQLLDVLYYHYFLFYRKVLNDPEPHFATVLSLSCSEALLINGAMDLIAIKWFCYQIAVWIQLGFVVFVIVGNYLFFHRFGRVKKIMTAKPLIAGSKPLSIVLTLLFFLITASWVFWGPIYGKEILSRCK